MLTSNDLRREVARLEVNHHKAAQLQMVKQQVEVEILIADLKMHLSSDERETRAQLQQEFLDVFDQFFLHGALVGVVAQREEIEEVGQSSGERSLSRNRQW